MALDRTGSVFIGRDSSNSWAAQPFIPEISDINGVMIEIRRTGNPGDLAVHIRETLTGADLPGGTITVSAGSITTEWGNWLDAQIPGSAIEVNPNGTYYLALTTATQSTIDYYEWGTTTQTNSCPYANGILHTCNSDGACTGINLTMWENTTYNDARFRVYSYV
jgi:hypothetical protein